MRLNRETSHPPSLVLDAGDGVRVACDAYGPPEAGHALVVAPGFWRRRTSPVLTDFARAMAGAGRRVFLFSFRGHGDSGGTYTFGREEPLDLLAVMRAALAEREGRVLSIAGFSLGGSIALAALARFMEMKEQVRRVVTVGSPADFRRIKMNILKLPEALPHLSLYEAARPPRVSLSAYTHPPPPFTEAAALLSPVPLAVLHTPNDWLVGTEHARMLYEAAREPKTLHIFPYEEALHADALMLRHGEEFMRKMEEVLEGD